MRTENPTVLKTETSGNNTGWTDLRCPDGYIIRSRRFTPLGPVRASVLINPGVGIRQRFYGKIAHWLSENGFAVQTYDYRGIAESAPADFQNFTCRATDWAVQDMETARAALKSAYPDKPSLLLSHSFGGQVVGLLPGWSEIDGLILVGSGTGSQRNYSLKQRLLHGLMWHVIFPYTSRKRHVLPGWVMGGEPVPSGFMQEWKRWCHSRDYLFEHFGRSIPAEWNHYSQLEIPIYVYHTTDDTIVTLKGLDHLLSKYNRCKIEKNIIEPKDWGVPAIGHTAMFRESYRDTFWNRVLADLNRLADRGKR